MAHRNILMLAFHCVQCAMYMYMYVYICIHVCHIHDVIRDVDRKKERKTERKTPEAMYMYVIKKVMSFWGLGQ